MRFVDHSYTRSEVEISEGLGGGSRHGKSSIPLAAAIKTRTIQTDSKARETLIIAQYNESNGRRPMLNHLVTHHH